MFPIKAWSFLRLAPILAQALWGTAKSHLIGTKDTPIIRYHSGNSKHHISSMPETGTKTNYFSMIPHHLSLTVDSNVYVIYSRVQATIRCGFTCENPIEEVEAEEAKPYEIYVYNKGGRLLKQFGVDTVYDEVKLIDNVIAGFSGNVCYMIRTNGSEAFYGDMGKNIVDILPTNSKTEFLFVYSESCARVRLRNEIIMEEETETVEIEE